MIGKWVVNASPLIVLAKIGQVSLLYDLCEELVIPSGVAGEIEEGPDDDPARKWMRDYGKKLVKDVGRINPVIAAWDLGRGESEVISWAYGHPDYEAVVDDRVARNCAVSLNVKVRGTIGIILLAKRMNEIDQISHVIDELRNAGFRIHPKILETIKRLEIQIPPKK